MQIGDQTRQGKRQGQAAKWPDPPSWECNAGITKTKAQEGKDPPDARLCVLDAINCHPQPDQHGRGHCRLGRGSTHLFSRQAFLRQRDGVAAFIFIVGPRSNALLSRFLAVNGLF